jgi:hypothetical protein
MFDIEATKRQLGIETKKANFEHEACAKTANTANNSKKFSHFSHISTPSKPKTNFSQQRKACFWRYKINSDSAGLTQMGLITNDMDEAQKQLTAIYGKPVSGLHKK